MIAMPTYENFCYMDFDEVFNIFWARGFDGYEEYKTGHYYSPAVVEAFLQMAMKHQLHIAWATTWEEGIHRMAEKIGFADTLNYEVLPAHESDANLDTWLKFDSVSAHYQLHQPKNTIWLDDDISSYPFAVEWCQANGIRWLSPSKLTGLVLSDIVLLDEWFSSQK